MPGEPGGGRRAPGTARPRGRPRARRRTGSARAPTAVVAIVPSACSSTGAAAPASVAPRPCRSTVAPLWSWPSRPRVSRPVGSSVPVSVGPDATATTLPVTASAVALGSGTRVGAVLGVSAGTGTPVLGVAVGLVAPGVSVGTAVAVGDGETEGEAEGDAEPPGAAGATAGGVVVVGARGHGRHGGCRAGGCGRPRRHGRHRRGGTGGSTRWARPWGRCWATARRCSAHRPCRRCRPRRTRPPRR